MEVKAILRLRNNHMAGNFTPKAGNFTPENGIRLRRY